MSMLDNIDEKLRAMGRKAIADAHAHGLPAVYLHDGAITWEYPGGELVDDAEHDRRLAAEDIAADSPEKTDFRRRIDSRYALLACSPTSGELAELEEATVLVEEARAADREQKKTPER
jgi:hypothetical protein